MSMGCFTNPPTSRSRVKSLAVSAAVVAGIGIAGQTRGATLPLNATGWNIDAVWANSEPTFGPPSFYSPGNNGNIAYYEKGSGHYSSVGGLPAGDASFVSAANANTTFQVPSYTANNFLDLGPIPAAAGTSVSSGTLALSTSGKFDTIAVLNATSSNTNSQTITYSLNFSSGSPTTGTFTSGDWNTTATPGTNLTTPAIAAGLSQTSTSTAFSGTGYLWEFDIALSPADQQRTLQSIDFSVPSTTGGTQWIAGISGEAVPEPAAIGMLGLTGLGLLRRRRCR